MSDELVFTVDQISAANTALRTALGKPPEHFAVHHFVAMISEEIDGLRTKGWNDGDIAALVAESTGSVFTAAHVADHYLPADRRRGPSCRRSVDDRERGMSTTSLMACGRGGPASWPAWTSRS